MKIELISKSSAFTRNLGSLFTRVFSSQDTILLSGELGAGKTTFISGIAKGLGLKENLSSPSFTILNIYRIGSKKKLVHADFYRLNTVDEVLNAGIEDYVYDNNSFVCIEWGDIIREYLKVNFLEINFSYFLNNDSSGLDNSSGSGTGPKDFYYNVAENNLDQKRHIVFRSSNIYWDKKLETFQTLLAKIKNNIFTA